MAESGRSRVNDPETVRREYATEERFLARRLATWAELDGPLVEDAVVDAVAEGAPVRMLDAGCGTGDFTQRLQRELAVQLVALDLSPRMVDLAHARGLSAVNGDIQDLTFADEAFDCVIANRVLYHLPNIDVGLSEIARVLRPGGRLVAVTYRADHLRELWELVGRSPIAAAADVEDNGARDLRRHFDAVERRDYTGRARFPDRGTVLGYLAAYGEFSDGDLVGRLGEFPAPLDASYRHVLFIAHKH